MEASTSGIAHSDAGGSLRLAVIGFLLSRRPFAATKLHADEREELLAVADALLFGDPDGEQGLARALDLITRLRDSERWSAESCASTSTAADRSPRGPDRGRPGWRSLRPGALRRSLVGGDKGMTGSVSSRLAHREARAARAGDHRETWTGKDRLLLVVDALGVVREYAGGRYWCRFGRNGRMHDQERGSDDPR